MASPSGNHSSSADDPPISTTTTLRLPPFWRQNPPSWFRQVETQFQLRHIQSQQSKYFHVLAGLPPEVAAELDDVLAAVQLDQPYDVLRTAILDRMEVSARAKLEQLFSDEDLGDRKPSQMLHRMKQLLGDSATEAQQPILREVFFQRLTQAMRVVLAGSEDLSLDRLATLADRIADYSEPPKPSIMAAATSEQSPRLDRIELQLQQLTDALQSLTAAGAVAVPLPYPAVAHHRLLLKNPRPLTGFSGKPTGRSVMAAGDPGPTPSRLFTIRDRIAGYRLVVYTGAEFSVIPASAADRRRSHSGSNLQAANGTAIKTYGLRSLTLDLELRRTFRWVFVIADVTQPKLGADFLAFFNLAVNVRHRRLCDSTTTLKVTGASSPQAPTGIRALRPPSPYAALLDEFPDITKPCNLKA
ncbi:uncharacterized protein LOC135385914 [Ornithodoros turicata]|uniref:uncharacterized protein LOC135385914 n=1 Tax=Ornithodoros turicata TaxID=34597 RepID=UPI00313A0A3C